jgi:transposase
MLYTVGITKANTTTQEKEDHPMQKENSKLDFTGQDIYVGIDVGKKSWKVTILTAEHEHKTFSQVPKPAALVKYLHKNFPGARYVSAYEAGYFGFWIHDTLRQQGVECYVVHPADVPTKDKERRNRNDAVDARKIAHSLRNGELTPLYVPTGKELEARSLVRGRSRTVKKQTRCKNQIKASLTMYGESIPEELEHSHWSRNFIRWLENLSMQGYTGNYELQSLLEELKCLRHIIAQQTRQIRGLAREEPYIRPAICLDSVPGIGILTAMILLTELMDINRFRSLDHLASYVGLIPGEDSSGDQQRTTGITHRRNAHLRSLLIECSWVAVRKDPALMMSFNNLMKRMPKNRAIVRIARKLLNRIRYVLKHQELYESCVVA